ncbi:MAG: DMT family transporter [Muribaculaceae bacterium]|nr:DMT family transporter [Muribaculaceae bacterium]
MGDFSIKGHAAMFCANVTWGLMAPVAKLVMASGVIAPLILVDFRVAGAAVLFWIASLFCKREHVPPRDLLLLAGAGLLSVVFNQGCFIFGVGLTSPGEASIITTTMPLWVMVLAAVILKEPVTLKKVGGILLGASGALILVLGRVGAEVPGQNPLAGDVLVFVAQFSYALYLTLYRNFIRKYSLVTLMKWMFTFASLAVIPASLSTIRSTQWGLVTHEEAIGVACVVVFATFLAYVCIMTGQKNLRPTVVGMYNYVQPLVASALGVYLGFDSFTPLKCVAVVLIFSGVYLVTVSRARSASR